MSWSCAVTPAHVVNTKGVRALLNKIKIKLVKGISFLDLYLFVPPITNAPSDAKSAPVGADCRHFGKSGPIRVQIQGWFRFQRRTSPYLSKSGPQTTSHQEQICQSSWGNIPAGGMQMKGQRSGFSVFLQQTVSGPKTKQQVEKTIPSR